MSTRPLILLIDDDEDMLDYLRVGLEDLDLLLVTSNSAKDAIQVVQSGKISGIFCDLSMPAITGLNFLAQVKSVDPFVPFVIVSGHRNEDTLLEALRLGATDYLLKPVKLDDLKEVVLRMHEIGKRNIEIHKLDQQIRESADPSEMIKCFDKIKKEQKKISLLKIFNNQQQLF